MALAPMEQEVRSSGPQLTSALHEDAAGDGEPGRDIPLPGIRRPSRKMLVQLVAAALYCMAMTGALTGVAAYNVEIRRTLYGAAGDGGNDATSGTTGNEVAAAAIPSEEPPQKSAPPSPAAATGVSDPAAHGSSSRIPPARPTPDPEDAGGSRSLAAERTAAGALPTTPGVPPGGSEPVAEAPIVTESSEPALLPSAPVAAPAPHAVAARPGPAAAARTLIGRQPRLRQAQPHGRQFHVSRRRYYRRGGWRRETARARW